MQRQRAMSWRRVGKAAQGLAAHALLFCFTLFVALKIDGRMSYSWWIIFVPLWLFHAVVARGRFSLPAPSLPHDRHWAPCHAVVATPLLIAFELLLCIYLYSINVSAERAINLKVVFLPLLILEIIILVDNFRMCRALMPGDEESISDDAIWEMLPHFWVAISMVFLIAATVFTLLKLCGDVDAFGWWELFINFGIAEFFAFLICTKWSNQMIHRHPYHGEACSSSTTIRYRDWNSGLLLSSMEEHDQDRLCSLQDVGGHIMKVPLVVFQVLLCMRLEGTPPGARHIPSFALFLPLFLLQGAGVLYAVSRLVEKLVLLLHSGTIDSRYLRISSRVHDFFAFLHHGSRLLGWWSIDEGNKEDQARLFHAETTGPCLLASSPPCTIALASKNREEMALVLMAPAQQTITGSVQIKHLVLEKILDQNIYCSNNHSGIKYDTFCGYPPEVVKKMAKKDLAEEVWRLQAALGEQAEITKYSQQEYERLQNEKVLCRICFEAEICMVLLPCRHRILCKRCSEKCKKCPICRIPIVELMPVYDV
ncbi:unnamed protein product [Musa banksii]